MDVKIYPGWPLAEQLDLDLAGKLISASGQTMDRPNGKAAHVSIFPLQGGTAVPYQILDNFFTIVPPVYGLTGSTAQGASSGQVLTLTGAPGAGEFATVIADNNYISSHTGATAAAILSAIASDLSSHYPGISVTASTLTLPTAAYLTARIGAPATMGKVTHRQKQTVKVTIWAPDPKTRTLLAVAIDGIIKQSITVRMPDTTMALITYSRTNISDEGENRSIYRRDLDFECEYATVQQFTGYPVTAIPATLGPADIITEVFPPITQAV
jgi:hypothetical protein